MVDINVLITGVCIKNAYYEVSKIRCDTYLSEFPHLEKHFDKFQGKDKAVFNRTELIELMKNLEINGDDAIKQLYEVGIIRPKGKMIVANADTFEIPRLYRSGFGLTLRGRP